MSYSVAVHRQPLTFEEYLELEAQSTWKHELVGGELHAVACSSEEHNRIAVRIAAMLDGPAADSGCRLYGLDMKLRVGEQTGYYPDVMVVCDPDDNADYYKTSPCLIVEVLSRSTVATDRREKLLAYRRIPSLRDYLIVAQDHREVVHHQRDVGGAWRRHELSRDGVLSLHFPALEVPLDQLYTGIVALRE